MVCDLREERERDRRRLDERLRKRRAPCFFGDRDELDRPHREPAVCLGRGDPDSP